MLIDVIVHGVDEPTVIDLARIINERGITEDPFKLKPLLPGSVSFKNDAATLKNGFDAVPLTFAKVLEAKHVFEPLLNTYKLILTLATDKEELLKAIDASMDLEFHIVAHGEVKMNEAGIPIPILNDLAGIGASYFYGEGMSTVNFEHFGITSYPKDLWDMLTGNLPEPTEEGADNATVQYTWDRVLEGPVVYTPTDSLTYNLAGMMNNMLSGSGYTDEDIKKSLTTLINKL